MNSFDEFQKDGGFFSPKTLLISRSYKTVGVDSTTWSDHIDIRPTILALIRLKDDYAHEGRVLFEDLADSALPTSVVNSRQIITELAQVYQKINAPVGEFDLKTLQLSTKAIESFFITIQFPILSSPSE